MKNITVSMDEDTASWVRMEAARHGISVSRMLGEMLRERRLAESRYAAAARRYLARRPQALKGKGERYPDRAALHER